jgi:hypothetical protein
MKKLCTILILLMMLISISSIAIADDEAGEDNQEEQDQENLDSETEVEIEVMSNPLGAEIRLLQLQKALLKNILKGEMVVEVLDDLGFDDANITDLRDILTQMKELNDTIDDLLDDGLEELSSNESAQIFVENKTLAKNLTKQFREKLTETLNEMELNQLREKINEMVDGQLENLAKYIQSRIRQFNRNQLYRLYGLIGDADNEFIEQYLNQEITLGQAKLQINKIINNMTKEKRYSIFSEIKEENIKKKINAEAFIDQMHGKGKGKGKNGLI